MFVRVTDRDRTPPKLDLHLWRSLISKSSRNSKNTTKHLIHSEKKSDHVWVAEKVVLQIAVSKNATLATCSWSSNGYNNQRSPGAKSSPKSPQTHPSKVINDSNGHLIKSNRFFLKLGQNSTVDLERHPLPWRCASLLRRISGNSSKPWEALRRRCTTQSA